MLVRCHPEHVDPQRRLPIERERVRGGGVDVPALVERDRDGVRLEDVLVGGPADVREDGAQGFVSGDDVADGRDQGVGVEAAV